VEGEALVTVEPGAHLRVLVDGIVVENDVNGLSGRDLGRDGVEEADELLMAMALHVLADDGAVEHVEGGEQRGRPMALVVVRQGSEPPLLHGQAGLGAVERLNLRLLVQRQHDSVRRRIDVKPTTSRSLSANFGSLESLNCRQRWDWSPCAFQMRRTALALMPAAFAIMSAVQCVVSPGGSTSVSAITRSAMSGPRGGMREARVFVVQQPLEACRGEALLPTPDAGLGLAVCA
jgi:hypothetical protein